MQPSWPNGTSTSRRVRPREVSGRPEPEQGAGRSITKFLAAEHATGPTIVVFRGYLLDLGRLAADLLASLPALEQTVTDQGAAVFSIGPDRPVRAQLLPLISEVG